MKNIYNRVMTAWKAIVAGATPIIVALVTDVLGELSIAAQGYVTGAVTAVAVWWARNRPVS